MIREVKGEHLAAEAPKRTACSQVTTKHIGKPFVDGGSNMVEFRDEGVFEPVYEHFGNHDGHHGLYLLYQL